MTNLNVDQVIVSANESPLYLDFWPVVAWSYRTLYPETPVTLVFVTERLETDPFISKLREHGKVVLVKPVRDIPQAAQCKLARYFYAATQDERICYIDDIDWIPINRDWYASKTTQRKVNTILMVGPEVYGAGEGQCPASMMTGPGKLFRQLFNPNDLPFDQYLYSFRGRTGRHQDIDSKVQHEGMSCTTDQEHMGQLLFSDEALIVRLREERPTPLTFVQRGYTPGKDTIDRSCWDEADVSKLKSGGYLGAHAGRPYRDHTTGVDAILEYIRKTYGGTPPPTLHLKTPGVDPDMQFGGSGMTQEVYEWLCWNIPAGSAIVELGSGHVSTNYLSRYFYTVSIEHDPAYLNIYPAHYIYAPLDNGWYSVDRIKDGLEHRRLWQKPCRALIIDGPIGSEARGLMLSRMDLFSFRQPVIIDDINRPFEQQIMAIAAKRSGRSPRIIGQTAIV